MLLLRVLALALALAAAALSDADCEASAANCTQTERRHCARAESEVRHFARRCLQPTPSSGRRRPRWCRCCRSACQPTADSVGIAFIDGGEVHNKQRQHLGTRRRLRRRLRRLVRRLGGVSAHKRPVSRRRELMMQRLLDLELRLLSLRREEARSSHGNDISVRESNKSSRGRVMSKDTRGAKGKSARDDKKGTRWKKKSARRVGDKSSRRNWTGGSLEQRYFVDSPVANIAVGATESPAVGAARDSIPNASLPAPTGRSANSSDMLAWLSHLEEQRTAKVKAACLRVSCNRAKGELCLANVQDLPVCRCVTNVNCVNERRRLRQRRGRRRRRRRQRQRRDGPGNWTSTGTSASSLLRQFSGRMCAQLSGLPAERTYPSLCHMHSAVCSSDSQVLRLAEGPCANHDPESEALEALTDQKCAKCLARAWRGRECKRWRRQCQARRI